RQEFHPPVVIDGHQNPPATALSPPPTRRKIWCIHRTEWNTPRVRRVNLEVDVGLGNAQRPRVLRTLCSSRRVGLRVSDLDDDIALTLRVVRLHIRLHSAHRVPRRIDERLV